MRVDCDGETSCIASIVWNFRPRWRIGEDAAEHIRSMGMGVLRSAGSGHKVRWGSRSW